MEMVGKALLCDSCALRNYWNSTKQQIINMLKICLHPIFIKWAYVLPPFCHQLGEGVGFFARWGQRKVNSWERFTFWSLLITLLTTDKYKCSLISAIKPGRLVAFGHLPHPHRGWLMFVKVSCIELILFLPLLIHRCLLPRSSEGQWVSESCVSLREIIKATHTLGVLRVKSKLNEKLLTYTSCAWSRAFIILSHTERKEVEEDTRREESI